jgi:regulator of sirC expression with transglutaminase-like and TPR domain
VPLWRRELELVEQGALLISSIEEPDLKAEALSKQLDEIAGKVRARVQARLERDGADPDCTWEVDEILRGLNFVLFEEGGFHGNEHDYYDPKNSYLHQVLARKTGIPISLSVLYMCVAARLGIKMVGVNAPGHFLLRCYTGPGSKARMLYIDVFNSGRFLDSAELHQLLQRLGVREDRWEERLPTTRPRDLFARMLRNLVVAHRPPDDMRMMQRAAAELGAQSSSWPTSAAALLEKRVS